MMTAPLLTVRVAAIADAAQDCKHLTLVAAEPAPSPAWTPGAHIDLHLAPGLVRQYSLCGAPEDAHRYAVAVKLEPASRGGSKAVHERLRVGDRLQISPPRNHFAMASDAEHSLLIAAGIGITPIISMARALKATGRPFTLAAFVRAPQCLAFAAELADGPLASASRRHEGLDRAATAQALRRLLADRRSGSHAYVCGPAGFMACAQGTAQALGWPADAVHVEHFQPKQQDLSGPTDAGFRVRLARSGRVCEVAAHASIADALRAAGVAVPTSCEQGVCGSCITPVLAGRAVHRDSFLTPAEQSEGRLIALCVSRADTAELALDL
jgi:vanillate O-demethylase ferredoxin subunit